MELQSPTQEVREVERELLLQYGWRHVPDATGYPCYYANESDGCTMRRRAAERIVSQRHVTMRQMAEAQRREHENTGRVTIVGDEPTCPDCEGKGKDATGALCGECRGTGKVWTANYVVSRWGPVRYSLTEKGRAAIQEETRRLLTVHETEAAL